MACPEVEMTDATKLEPFELDAHEVAPGLWQGAVPPEGHAVAEAGFSMLVLCAEEYQFQADCFPGVRVVHAPMSWFSVKRSPVKRRIGAPSQRAAPWL